MSMFTLVLDIQLAVLGLVVVIAYLDMKYKQKQNIRFSSVLVFYVFVAILLTVVNSFIFLR